MSTTVQVSGELLTLCGLCVASACCQALLFLVKSPPARLSVFAPLFLLTAEGFLLVLVLPLNDPEALLVPLVATSTGLTAVLTLLCLFTRPVNAPAGYSPITTPDGRVPSEEDTASLAGYLSFSWVNSLLDRGQTHPLEEEDLPNLSMRDQMGSIVGEWMAYKGR
jgi:hypothetical protein